MKFLSKKITAFLLVGMLIAIPLVHADLQIGPFISQLTVSQNAYQPDDQNLLKLSYNYYVLPQGSYVNTKIYLSSNINKIIKEFPTAFLQNTGEITLSWDGKDGNNLAANGLYTFEVWGQAGATKLGPNKIEFALDNNLNLKCAGFTDVLATNVHCPAIVYVKSIGVMTGNPNGTFAPSGILQRDHVVKIALLSFKKFTGNVDYCKGVNPFPDITAQEWSFQYVCQGKNLNMITGYKSGADAGFYRPARAVNRVEFLALILRNLAESMPSIFDPSYSDVELGQWYSGYAKYSFDHNLFSGIKLFPTNNVSRVEAAEVIFQLHNLNKI